MGASEESLRRDMKGVLEGYDGLGMGFGWAWKFGREATCDRPWWGWRLGTLFWLFFVRNNKPSILVNSSPQSPGKLSKLKVLL